MHSARAKAIFLLLGGVAALALLGLVWMQGAGSSEAVQGDMQNCPEAGKWAISVWSGDNGADAGQALATCGTGAVTAAYYLDPQTQGWLRWFADRPEVSNLQTLNDMQGIIAAGAVGPSQVTPTPSPTTTPDGAGDVALVSTNAFTTTSSLLIDGESRRMHVVGELRNEATTPRSAGEIQITIYDGADNVVGSRWTLAFDDIIMPGRTTAFKVTYPSMIYSSGETNYFPEGWTRYEVELSSRDPYEWEEMPVDVAVENVQVTDGGRHVTGNAVNQSSETVGQYGVDVYVIYYRADGTILNTERDIAVNDQPLGPGESAAFDISLSSGQPLDFSSYVVQAYAEPE
jgi:hypothetical protein